MNIVVLGDLMLDKFSYGYVRRLNPESPVPLLNIDKEEFKLGGAANVAANISSLDEGVSLIGVLGSELDQTLDINGDIFYDICNVSNINLNYICKPIRTITKQRFIEKTYHQQMIRVDYEEKIKLSMEDRHKLLNFLEILTFDFLIISDYLKGTIDGDLILLIKEFCRNKNIKILVDSKPLNIHLFKGVYLYKPNFKEFCAIIGQNILNEDNLVEKFGIELVKEYQFNLVVTRGEKGATLITTDLCVYHLPTQAKEVYDVTGAGDTFIAALSVALKSGYPLYAAVEFGNKASGVVIGKVGTETIKKKDLGI